MFSHSLDNFVTSKQMFDKNFVISFVAEDVPPTPRPRNNFETSPDPGTPTWHVQRSTLLLETSQQKSNDRSGNFLKETRETSLEHTAQTIRWFNRQLSKDLKVKPVTSSRLREILQEDPPKQFSSNDRYKLCFMIEREVKACCDEH